MKTLPPGSCSRPRASTRRSWLAANVAGALAFAWRGATAQGAAPATAAPSTTVRWPAVRLLDGTDWAPATGRAQVVVFWSVSCPFCLRHNAHIDRLYRSLADGAGPGPQILTVCRDRDRSAVERYLARNQYRFPVTLDHDSLAASLAARRIIPLTVLVDSRGRLHQAIPGEMFEEDVMQLRSFN